MREWNKPTEHRYPSMELVARYDSIRVGGIIYYHCIEFKSYEGPDSYSLDLLASGTGMIRKRKSVGETYELRNLLLK